MMRVLPLLILAGVLLAETDTGAHKPITSKYTYSADVFPLFRDRCGVCHQPDGVAPMSLLTFQEARPWAQAIKEEVISLRMPPRYAEPAVGNLTNGQGLTAREIDMIIDWSTGGSPEGPPIAERGFGGLSDQHIATESPGHEVTGSPVPDLTLTLPEFTLDAETLEAMRVFVIPTGLTSHRLVAGVDVRPRARQAARSAVVYVDTSGTARALDRRFTGPGFPASEANGVTLGRVLSVWTPRHPPAAPAKFGYRLPAGADLVVKVHYKKTWKQEGQSITDRAVLDLYFARPGRLGVETLDVEAPRAIVDRDVDVVAAFPEIGAPLEVLRVDAVRPDGTREPMLLLNRPAPEWPERYVFRRPVALPRGSRIEVVGVPLRKNRPGPDSAPVVSAGASLSSSQGLAAGGAVTVHVDYLGREARR